MLALGQSIKLPGSVAVELIGVHKGLTWSAKPA
jgi:hypothetical protein